MPIFGNKGEWSELYAFLKILSDKVLYSADENLKLIPKSFIKILSIIKEDKNKKLFYEINDKNNFIIIKKNSEIIGTMPIVEITSKLSNILNKIKMGSKGKGAFEIIEASSLMNELYCDKIKSASSKKSDIILKIEDPVTGKHPIRGFSVKSKIGGLSTLLNSSRATNIRYRIIKTEKLIENKKYLIKLGTFLNSNETLQFDSVINKNFENNLIMVDSSMPEIIGEILKAYYLGLGSNLSSLVDFVEKKDPMNYGKGHNFYIYKIKQLLRAVAFGLQPSKIWYGDYEIHGGYIIVKEDGELACFHMYDRDNFGEFLFKNTKLETPSVSRHNFGKIYEINGSRYVDLNLQIRFIN